MHPPEKTDMEPIRQLVGLATLQLQELYEIKLLLIQSIGADKYQSIPHHKVAQYAAAKIPDLLDTLKS